MQNITESKLIEMVRETASPLTGKVTDYDPLMDRISNARFVLLGEASHGTHEFYHARAEITKRLIKEKGFRVIAVEADWPDSYRVNRYVQGLNHDKDAVEALAGFRRFPTWMWRNTVVVDFIEWLRRHNQALSNNRSKAGFYGLDLYSLRASMEAVLRYLEQTDLVAAHRLRLRYACFDHFGEDAQTYGFLTGTGAVESCKDEALAGLIELQNRSKDPCHDGVKSDALFDAVQNARVVKNAEEYYRKMFVREESTWNLRDRHMADTLDELVEQLDRQGGRTKVVVWAHNSHLGDARATEMAEKGEINLGQLVRKRHRDDAVLIGFTTHHGTVSAASDWEGQVERKRVQPALAGSYEAMLHATKLGRFLLIWHNGDPVMGGLSSPRLERAIGVIYRPDTERMSHYFRARLTEQFDAVLHFDETRAVEPLEPTSEWKTGEAPETFPFAV